jgi:hypothetical protein
MTSVAATTSTAVVPMAAMFATAATFPGGAMCAVASAASVAWNEDCHPYSDHRYRGDAHCNPDLHDRHGADLPELLLPAQEAKR